MRILLVDDEEYMAQAMAKILMKENYLVDIVGDGEQAIDYGTSGIYDLIILDIMLPKCDGFEVVRNLRANNVHIPILLLTAKNAIDDKVKGLDLGADDYLTKPFEIPELLARLRVLSRRKENKMKNNEFDWGDLLLDPYTLTLYCTKGQYKLTKKESQLMEMLITAKGKIITKDQILDKIWGFDSEAEDSNVEVYIYFLRQKIKGLNSKCCITTVRGVGYMLEAGEDNV
ncbi:MAG: response regulator transcription factor [Erysipelotrichaceae bacterium]|nr:response regulator transcription factor [Erysipelotrichaceae bacterium]MDY5251816.1 response regulator transcription factor [Erysipelotrichaceae bacterium]